MAVNKANKIKSLLTEREKIKKKLEYVDNIFREEKDNEESWPGHASTRYQSAENDRYVLVEHLRSIEEELKKLKSS